jgi:hypothetical protein
MEVNLPIAMKCHTNQSSLNIATSIIPQNYTTAVLFSLRCFMKTRKNLFNNFRVAHLMCRQRSGKLSKMIQSTGIYVEFNCRVLINFFLKIMAKFCDINFLVLCQIYINFLSIQVKINTKANVILIKDKQLLL